MKQIVHNYNGLINFNDTADNHLPKQSLHQNITHQSICDLFGHNYNVPNHVYNIPSAYIVQLYFQLRTFIM